MSTGRNRICPVEYAGHLDTRIRRWVQNPRKIVGPFLKEGMTVLEVGCGPGFFTLDMADMVGKTGKVIACDLQEGMLHKVRDKVQGTDLEGHITLHRCDHDRIGVCEPVDFVLAFYMVHEVPDQGAFFHEIHAHLKPGGHVLVVEPPFHVSKSAFEKTVEKARTAGLVPVKRPGVLFSKAVLLQRR
jgi:ubiquinone/menaquinone biosynthesis C-methylase UbiE